MKDLLAALCLVAVIEGLFLFAAPAAWKRMAGQLLQAPLQLLGRMGGIAMAVGLALLWWLRH